jgi:leukotriene-A4 hydrolase
VSLRELKTAGWSTQEWLRFLTSISNKLDAERMAQLDAAFHFTDSSNAEIEHQWLLLAIRNQYTPAFARLEEFLTTLGRRKFLKTLYSELIKTTEGRMTALTIYKKAYPFYHSITRSAIEEILRQEPYQIGQAPQLGDTSHQ